MILYYQELGPKIIMTDDDKGEISSLRSAWPESTFLLCQWHLLQVFLTKSHQKVRWICLCLCSHLFLCRCQVPPSLWWNVGKVRSLFTNLQCSEDFELKMCLSDSVSMSVTWSPIELKRKWVRYIFLFFDVIFSVNLAVALLQWQPYQERGPATPDWRIPQARVCQDPPGVWGRSGWNEGMCVLCKISSIHDLPWKVLRKSSRGLGDVQQNREATPHPWK